MQDIIKFKAAAQKKELSFMKQLEQAFQVIARLQNTSQLSQTHSGQYNI